MLVWCRKIKAGSSALFSNISCFTFPNSIMSFDILSWLVSDSGEKWLHLYQWEPIHKEVRCSLDIMSLWVVDGIFMVLTSIILFRVEKNILLLQYLVRNQGSLHWVWWKPQCQPCWISCSSINDVCCFLCNCESFFCHFHLPFYFYSCFFYQALLTLFSFLYLKRWQILRWLGLLWSTREKIQQT